MTYVDLDDISQIPGNECIGDSRDRINYNIDLLKTAVKNLSAATNTLVYTTGNVLTATGPVTATNVFVEVNALGSIKYLRLFDI